MAERRRPLRAPDASPASPPSPDAPPALWLASTSPRRLALLRQIGFEPRVEAVEIDETPLPDESPRALVRRLATAKARAIGAVPAGAVVLAADTVIDLDGRVLGKPRDRAHAVAMLLALGGREHRVLSGVCLRRAVGTHTVVVATRVRFGRVTPAAAARYWEGGEPAGKAGGYAVQGEGARFVACLSGSYSNVVGLPLHETARLLAAAGLEPGPPVSRPEPRPRPTRSSPSGRRRRR